MPVILRALQHHGSGAGGAEDQDEMSKEELSLQVQLERLLLYPLRRLPPCVMVAERGVAHRGGRVRLTGDARAALAAFCRRAGLLTAGCGHLFVEAEGLRGVGPADRLCSQHSALGQVTHLGVTGSAETTILHSWTFAFRRFW